MKFPVDAMASIGHPCPLRFRSFEVRPAHARRTRRVGRQRDHCGQPCWIQQPNVLIIAGVQGGSPDPAGGIAPPDTSE